MKIDDIRNRKFEKSFSGYRTDEVEIFLLKVSEEFSNLLNENKALEKKLDILADKIREYREDEEAIKEALLGAQKQSQIVISQANQKAKAILDEALAERDKILNKLIEEKSKLEFENKTIDKENQEKAEKIISEAVSHAKTIEAHLANKIEFQENLLSRKKAEINDFRNKVIDSVKQIEKLLFDMPEMEGSETQISNSMTSGSEISDNVSISHLTNPKEETLVNIRNDVSVQSERSQFVIQQETPSVQSNNDDMVFMTDNNDEIAAMK